MSESFLGFLSPHSIPNVVVPPPKALSGTAVVYAYLYGKAYLTAHEIKQGTGLPRGTVYAGLSNLCKADKVEREQVMPKGRRIEAQRFRRKERG